MMGKRQRIVTTTLWGLTVVCMLGLVGTGLWAKKQSDLRLRAADEHAALAADRHEDGNLPVYYAAAPFKLTDQNDASVTDQSLRGSIWVGLVFFTHCPDICPGMIGRLVDLQDAVPDARVKLVPFTIDPEKDTPEALKQYAEHIKADPRRWHFLTGTPDQMFAAASGLKLAAEPATDETPIVHSGKFLLIDAEGNVRGVYDHKFDEDMSRLAADATSLLEDLSNQRGAPGGGDFRP